MESMYSKWIKALGGTPDEDVLIKMASKERNDAFSGSISFGTGGLRGIMGLGTNRLNRYTIERVTHGLAKTILAFDAPKSVGVAYDTRHKSDEFAKIVCETLSAFGIDVYIFDKPMPTPVLSHAIRLMKLGWGVCITASHNPQEYNGYKVYDKHGVQVTDNTASKITENINSVDFFEPIPGADRKKINYFDKSVEDAYFEQIILFVGVEQQPSDYPFVFTALYGAGANAVPYVLKKLGFSPICVQQNPDGAFGGLKTPNPEEPVVYEKALAEARRVGAKLLLATDPDCDRVGVMEKTEKGFELLNGNQIGALLIDYLIQTKDAQKGDTVISTIVSGKLGEMISKNHGLDFTRLLTGFKYIGEHIVSLPKGKQFFFGYEESYGYLAGDGARDKDAVIASALIVKMAAFYDAKGKTLISRLQELSEKYGYCLEALHSAEVSMHRQKEIMESLRDGEISIEGATEIKDYAHGLEGLPPADVIKLLFRSDTGDSLIESWAAIRPSGTEPKLKIYAGVHAKTYEVAKVTLKSLTDIVGCILLN